MGSPSVARGSRPRGEVAAFPWNQWQRFPGMGGRLALESVAAFVWNRWQLWHGISGNVRVESPAGLPWNQWQVWRGIRTRVLMEARPEFPIHFLKIYSAALAVNRV